MTATNQTIEQLSINTIRTLSIDAVEKANSGHPGMPMGAAPMAYALWTKYETQSVQSELDQPRPLRALRGTRIDAAVQLAASVRL